MKYILFAINFIPHCYLALGALPAPVNVRVESVNFEPILQWMPGQGTPPGTAYRVKYTCHGKQLGLKPSFLNSSVTMLNLTGTFKDLKCPYGIHVQALNGDVESNWSSQVFCPYTDTKLGPPQVSVTGHGDHLLLNITLPRGKAKKSIEEIYREFHFSIFWKKAGESRVQKDTTALKEPAINHLHQGVQYCVQVQPEIIENQNLLSSDWTCHFTSPLPLNPVNPLQTAIRYLWGRPKVVLNVPTVLACVSVILILGSCAVLLGLIYTGFLCNWNPKPPNALMSLVQSYFLNVAVIVPDQVSVISEPKGIGGATGGGAQDNNEEEEEDGGNGGYENRAAGSSGATSSSSGGTDTALTTDTSVSEDSGNSRTLCTMRVECGVPCAVGVLSLSERAAITGPSLSKQKQKEEEEEEGGDAEGEEGHCTDINLFSVALGEQEQEEEEVGDEEGWAAELQPMDSEGEHQPLISVETDAGSRLIELGSSQTDDTVLSYLPRSSNQSEQGKTHSCYLQMHFEGSIQIDSQSALKERQEEEDEDEEGGDEEYSGYMRR